MAENGKNGTKILLFPFSGHFFSPTSPVRRKSIFLQFCPISGRDRSGENDALVKMQGVAPKIENPYRDERGLSILKNLIIVAV